MKLEYYKLFIASETQEEESKETNLNLEEYSLSEVTKDESLGEKCIKWVHHKKNKSFFMK